VVEFGTTALRICLPEDLIIMKAFANRDRDWSDISGILNRCLDALDFDYIREQLAPLVAIKSGEGILEKLEARMRD
jgi:hypothetical protein